MLHRAFALPSSEAARTLFVVLTRVVAVGGLFVAAVLACGRLANSTPAPLAPWEFAICIAAAIAWWAIVRWALVALATTSSNPAAAPKTSALELLPTTGLVLSAVAISHSENSLPGVVLGYGALLAVEIAYWRWKQRHTRGAGAPRTFSDPLPQHDKTADHCHRPEIPTQGAVPAMFDSESVAPPFNDRPCEGELACNGEAAGDYEAFLHAEAAGEVVQQYTRSRLPLGGEVMAGTLMAEFAAGQRTASLHIAFCPPFLELPECSAEASDGADVEIKLVLLLPYGARFDVRRRGSCEQPATWRLEFCAFSAPSSSAIASGR